MNQPRLFFLILCAVVMQLAVDAAPGQSTASPQTALPMPASEPKRFDRASETVVFRKSLASDSGVASVTGMIHGNTASAPIPGSASLLLAGSAASTSVQASVTFPILTLASGATDPFYIPTRPADTVITSESLEMASGATILVNNVRAVDGDKILTCGKAYLWREPDRLLATQTPRMYQKESIPDKMLTRETTLDALNIHWNKGTDRLSASPSVTVKIEERSWDLATYTCVTISADSLEGYPGQHLLNFQGNVRIRDKERYGQGRRLDYDKGKGTVTLRGEAHVEKEEWSPKEKRMIKRVLEGETINYDIASKTTASE